MNDVSGDEQPEDVALTHTPFWVRILKLSFNYRSDYEISMLASGLGQVLEIEEDYSGRA